jgi:ABC-type bacteriocin/lantibiotic exporter with double-glycine peptidase domain
MRYQSRKSSCGPGSLANALEAIGVVRSEDELAVMTHQTTEGTSSINLRKAVESIGLEVVNISEQRASVASWAIGHYVRSGNPGLLVVDNDTHWVAVVGMLGEHFIVVDGADNELVLYYSLDALVERWKNDNNKFSGFFIIKDSNGKVP